MVLKSTGFDKIEKSKSGKKALNSNKKLILHLYEGIDFRNGKSEKFPF